MSEPLARQPLQQRVAAAILDGAARIFAVEGEQASMNDVAAAAGVARATVYRYFPNRQALLDELARAAVSDADARLASARIDEVPPGGGHGARGSRPGRRRGLRSCSWRASGCDPTPIGSSAGSSSRCASCSSAVRQRATSGGDIAEPRA